MGCGSRYAGRSGWGSEEAQDIGQQQLLLLLLVIDAERDERGERICRVADKSFREQSAERCVNCAR
ncbi:MAG: hypothetical protein WDN31_07885 [Hyphomicrobium sp.]